LGEKRIIKIILKKDIKHNRYKVRAIFQVPQPTRQILLGMPTNQIRLLPVHA